MAVHLSQPVVWLPSAVVAVEVVLLVLALVLVPRGRRPSSALAWILLFLLLPVAGAIAFLVIGSPKLPRARREKQRSMSRLIKERARDLDPVSEDHATPPWLKSVATLNQDLGAMPMLEANDAHLLSHFAEQLAAMTKEVHAARRYVHVEFYIFSVDATTAPFFAALADAVRRGVSVKVLLDHIGSRGYPGYRDTVAELDRIGADWRLMLPVQLLKGRYQRPDLRNHRKLLVIDGEVAFVGSLNLIDPGYQKRRNRKRGLQWRDLMVRLEGPVVHEVDALFVTDWYSETDELITTSREEVQVRDPDNTLLCQVAPSGPGFEVENNLVLFNTLIYYAQRRLSITSPYFVPDESLLIAITTAARRGVAVELFVGEIGDQALTAHAQHSYYEALLAAGVRIYLHPAPFILHAKHMSVDELVAVVGSSNMDIRSFTLDLELSLVVCGRDFADEMRAVENEYRSRSRELLPQEWSTRGAGHRIVDDLARLTSAVQ